MVALSDKPISLAKAARLLPNRPNPSTLWRWRTKGVRGVKLETKLIGGRRFVYPAALNRFIEAVTAAASKADQPAPSEPAAGKRPRSSETSRRLKRAGLMP